MKKRLFATHSALASMALAAVTLVSCVDDTYDLDKDIDTSIHIDIDNLSLPTSAIEPITLATLLDLEDYDDVDTVTADNVKNEPQRFTRMFEGDYYFLSRSKNSTESHVNVSAIVIDPTDHTSGTSQDLRFTSVNFDGGRQQREILDLKTDVKLYSETITDEIEVLNWADVDVPITLDIALSGDNLPEKIILEKGLQLEFTDYMTLVSNDTFEVDPTKPYIATLKRELLLPKHTSTAVNLKMSHIDCTKMSHQGDDLGLYEKGHFSMRPNVEVHGFAVMLENDFPRGVNEVALNINADISIGRVTLNNRANGVFTPKNSYEIDPVKISNLPDFMTDEGTSVVLADPRVTFWAESVDMEGLDIALNDIKVIPMQDGQEIEDNIVTISRIEFDTKTSVVNSLYIDNYSGNISPSLTKLMDGIVPEEVTFEMGRIEIVGTILLDYRYTIYMDYEMLSPFSLDTGSRIHYEETMDGMNSDIIDMYDEVDVEKAELTFELHYINTVPINMTVTEATPIDTEGNEIDEIAVILENASIKAGKQDQGTEGTVTIKLKQHPDKTFENFDGLRFSFDADVDEAHAKQTLNTSQRLHFDALNVTVSGAIDYEP